MFVPNLNIQFNFVNGRIIQFNLVNDGIIQFNIVNEGFRTNDFLAPWYSGSVFDHRSLPPVCKSRRGHM